MSQKYTLVTVDHGGGERYEALYADGSKIAEPDGGGPFSAASLLEALATHNISIVPEYVEVAPEWDMEHSADGWPERLSDFPDEAKS